jgi:3-hydroxy-9,10-secoandrosta-1,3,5(10)-triene-9,17-dione monooxygenase
MSRHALAPGIAEVLDGIEEASPLIRQRAAENEINRHLDEGTIGALQAAGVFRIGVPRRFGGLGATTREQIDIARAVARADGSAGWVTGLLNSGAYAVGWFLLEAQQEVFANGPDTRVSIMLAPSSMAAEVAGGYRLSGEWRYNSGSWHSTWAILGAPLHDDAGRFEDNAIVLVPRQDLEYKDTWHVAGLKSTASNTYTAHDIFVPEHRVLRMTPALKGAYPGVDKHSADVHRAAFIPELEAQLLGAHLGMGDTVLDLVREAAPTKSIAYTTYMCQADSVPFQLELARAALLLEAAELFAYRTADEIDDAASSGTYLDYAARARQRGQQSQVVSNVRTAVDSLMTAHGSAGFAESSVLQRFWRDQAIAARHGLTLPDTGLEVYGKWLATGQEGNSVTPLV